MLTRYDENIEWFHGYESIPKAIMTESNDGEYVRYDDVKKLISELFEMFNDNVD